MTYYFDLQDKSQWRDFQSRVVSKVNRKRVATLAKDLAAAITNVDVMGSSYDEAKRLKELKENIGWDNTRDLTEILCDAGKIDRQMLNDSAIDAAMCMARMDEAQRISRHKTKMDAFSEKMERGADTASLEDVAADAEVDGDGSSAGTGALASIQI